jgi:hypothetical protein
MMAELLSQTRLPPPKDRSVARGMGLGTVTPTLLESFKRLTDLLYPKRSMCWRRS